MPRPDSLYRGPFRLASRDELKALNDSPFREALFVPALAPLGRAATAADVAEGKAVFELGGQGKVADQKLPAIASIKRSQSAKPADNSNGTPKVVFESDVKSRRAPDKVIVVQAEVGADKIVHYGVVGRYAIRAVTADILSDFKQIAPATR